jgi:hypothetical protein
MNKARWIASFPKSGNTWVRMFINAYITGHLDINHQFLTTSDISPGAYQSVSDLPIKTMSRYDILNYRHAALRNEVYRRLPEPVFFKTHNACRQIDDIWLIPKNFTQGAVYLVRDPRDIAPSWADHCKINLEKAIFQMSDPDFALCRDNMVHWASSWSNHVKSWMEPTVPTLLVKYELLKDDPEKHFTNMLKHFEIDIDKKRIRKAIKMTEIEKLKEQEEKYDFREKRGKEHFFGGNRQKLTEKHKARIEEDHGEVMKLLEYI